MKKLRFLGGEVRLAWTGAVSTYRRIHPAGGNRPRVLTEIADGRFRSSGPGGPSSAAKWRSRRIRSLGSGCDDSRRGSRMRTAPGNAPDVIRFCAISISSRARASPAGSPVNAIAFEIRLIFALSRQGPQDEVRDDRCRDEHAEGKPVHSFRRARICRATTLQWQ